MLIAVSFSSPPKSRKKNKLLDHILTTMHILLTIYPESGLIIRGDKNDLDIAPLISGIPRVQQIVNSPTLNSKILDIIITNLHQLYHVRVVVPLSNLTTQTVVYLVTIAYQLQHHCLAQAQAKTQNTKLKLSDPCQNLE